MKYPTFKQLKKLIKRDLKQFVFTEVCKVRTLDDAVIAKVPFQVPKLSDSHVKINAKAGFFLTYDICEFGKELRLMIQKGFQIYTDGSEKIPLKSGYQIICEAKSELDTISNKFETYAAGLKFNHTNSYSGEIYAITPQKYAENCNYWQDKLKKITFEMQDRLEKTKFKK